MIVYHRTHHADAILRDGFRDTEGTYLTAERWRGVWISAPWPLDENEGADGDAVLAIEIPETVFVTHEWVEEGKTYREALIPAEELNRYPVRIVTDDELDALTVARFGKGLGH